MVVTGNTVRTKHRNLPHNSNNPISIFNLCKNIFFKKQNIYQKQTTIDFFEIGNPITVNQTMHDNAFKYSYKGFTKVKR